MSSADTNQVGAAGEGAGLDPREAAQILDEAKRQARREVSGRARRQRQAQAAAIAAAGVGAWVIEGALRYLP
jgi:uncharacterized membrane protein